tara:strand:- start:207 stop:353 length:147 start_codon:yes stop_codon:yes gene_type:complete
VTKNFDKKESESSHPVHTTLAGYIAEKMARITGSMRERTKILKENIRA